ncbi:MAG: aldo/keto reductase, partial [Planctomycetota bacterium]
MQSIKIGSDIDVPSVGFGFWKVDNSVCWQVAVDAIEAGYRHLDCAADYGNEIEVGEGIKRAIDSGSVTRDQLWVTSKLWNNFHRPEHVRLAAEKSLSDLGLDQLDLYLMHFPIALEYVPIEERYPPGWFHDPEVDHPVMNPIDVPLGDTWQAMEELVEQGLVKHIGVCNFGVSLLRDLRSRARIQPAMLQIELHPYLTQQKLVRYCHEVGMGVTAFSPLGAQSYFELSMADASESAINQKAIVSIAEDV